MKYEKVQDGGVSSPEQLPFNTYFNPKRVERWAECGRSLNLINTVIHVRIALKHSRSNESGVPHTDPVNDRHKRPS